MQKGEIPDPRAGSTKFRAPPLSAAGVRVGYYLDSIWIVSRYYLDLITQFNDRQGGIHMSVLAMLFTSYQHAVSFNVWYIVS